MKKIIFSNYQGQGPKLYDVKITIESEDKDLNEFYDQLIRDKLRERNNIILLK
jgi:hypothetical protein